MTGGPGSTDYFFGRLCNINATAFAMRIYRVFPGNLQKRN